MKKTSLILVMISITASLLLASCCPVCPTIANSNKTPMLYGDQIMFKNTSSVSLRFYIVNESASLPLNIFNKVDDFNLRAGESIIKTYPGIGTSISVASPATPLTGIFDYSAVSQLNPIRLGKGCEYNGTLANEF